MRAWAAAACAVLVSTPAVATREAFWAEPPKHERPAAGLPDLAGLVRRAMPAVVSLAVEQRREPNGDPLHELFERAYGDEPSEGLGAGFVIHSSGLVLTNTHVVENAARIRVTIDDGKGGQQVLTARIVGKDNETDIALLQIEAGRPLPVLPLGDSDSVEIADWVVAIGNPFGLTQSVSFGIVSQKGRTDVAPAGREGYFDFIQTDASMNPGSSGGPLLNLHGEVIAINNAINASGQGIGFAVPVNMAKEVIPQLARSGKVSRSWMGLAVQDLPPEELRTTGAVMGAVVVSEITPEGPASKAGLEVGDVIVRWDGRKLGGAHRLRWDVACGGLGRRVALEVLRAGRKLDVMVTLAATPEVAAPKIEPAIHFLGALGAAVEDLDRNAAVAAGVTAGLGARVVDVEPGGVARRAGLKKGDLLVGVGARKVASAADASKAIAELPSGALVELVVRRGADDARIALRKP